MMLVNPGYRSRGLGARLLEAAMGALPRDLPIRLDATPLGRPLYERYQFVLESSLTRHVRPATESQRPVPSARVRPLVESDLSAIVQTDERVSGAHRHSALRWAFGDAPHYAWIDSEGATTGGRAGYCLGRGGRLFDHIGPVVADTPETAATLAAAAIGESDGRAVVVDAHDSNQDFVAWLRTERFEAQRPLYRMCRAGRAPLRVHHPGTLIEFAIMGPEFS
jgi:hypothetical protein